MKIHALVLTAALGAGALALALEDDAAADRRKAVGYDGTSTIVLQVKDLRASLAWYQEKLGFELIFIADSMPFGEVQSSVGGMAIGMSQKPEPRTDGPAVTFGVADIDVARAALEKAGVVFDAPTIVNEGLVKLAYFKDPTGNQLVLHESLMTEEKR